MDTIRISFEKTEEASYISLLDLQRLMHRALKQSGVPVWYTLGYNPHIYLTFACPLPLGQESLCESCDVKTEQENIDGAAWMAALNEVMPSGLRVTSVHPALCKAKVIASADYTVTMPAAFATILDTYNKAESVVVDKKTKSGIKPFEMKAVLPQIQWHTEGESLQFDVNLPAGDAQNVNPALMFAAFGQLDAAFAPWQCSILRKRLLAVDGTVFE